LQCHIECHDNLTRQLRPFELWSVFCPTVSMAPALAIRWMAASVALEKGKRLDPDGEIVQFRYPGRARLNSSTEISIT
jgi:hypothetical protein